MTESGTSLGRELTGFLLHPAAALHDPGWGHPEHQGRLRGLVSAVSKDMLTWEKKGPILYFGKPGEDDSAGACYGVTYKD